MIITRKHLSRRTVLRGTGAAIALPFLDAMHPALSAERNTAAAPVRRLNIVQYPLGVVPETWDPIGEGKDYKISDGLSPIAHFREKFVIFRGMKSSPDMTKADFHDRAVCTYLTGCEPNNGATKVGISIDQIAAKHFASTTQFASLEFATQIAEADRALCYRDESTPLPMQHNPRLMFERLFGDGAEVNPAAQKARIADDGSLLDSVKGSIDNLNRQLGAPDRIKLDQYLEAARDIERRVQVASKSDDVELPHIARPAGIPDSWPDHVKLMFDLQAIALQADLTRVCTFAMAREASALGFPQLGFSMTFHEISHHNFEQYKLDALSKINKLHSELFAYYLEKMEGIKEPSGSLLDNTMLFYGSNLSNPSVHSQHNLPIIIAGGGNMGVKHGRFVRIPTTNGEVPLSNLHVAMLQKVGVPIEKVGDSSGVLSQLEG